MLEEFIYIYMFTRNPIFASLYIFPKAFNFLEMEIVFLGESPHDPKSFINSEIAWKSLNFSITFCFKRSGKISQTFEKKIYLGYSYYKMERNHCSVCWSIFKMRKWVIEINCSIRSEN